MHAELAENLPPVVFNRARAQAKLTADFLGRESVREQIADRLLLGRQDRRHSAFSETGCGCFAAARASKYCFSHARERSSCSACFLASGYGLSALLIRETPALDNREPEAALAAIRSAPASRPCDLEEVPFH